MLYKNWKNEKDIGLKLKKKKKKKSLRLYKNDKLKLDFKLKLINLTHIHKTSRVQLSSTSSKFTESQSSQNHRSTNILYSLRILVGLTV